MTEIYKEVALTKDIPQQRLRKGDIGTVVEKLSRGQQTGYAVEFFTAAGETVALVVVDEGNIEPLKHDEILHVRKLEAA